MSKVLVANCGTVLFWCPGCQGYHGVQTKTPNSVTGGPWRWNGDTANPTIEPSVLVHPHEKLTENPPDNLDAAALQEWCDLHRVKTPLCHSFVRNGKIEYLSDCTHSLAGKTIEMKEDE